MVRFLIVAAVLFLASSVSAAPSRSQTPWDSMKKPRITAVAFSADSRYLAYGGDVEFVRIYDLKTRKTVAALEMRDSLVMALAFSPDGQYLAAGGYDRAVTVWRLSDRSVFRKLEKRKEDITDLAWRPDGSQLTFSMYNGVTAVMSFPEWKQKHILVGHSVNYSPDGKRIAAGGVLGMLHVFDADSGKAVFKMLGHDNFAVNGVEFTSDGRRLFSSGATKVIEWDLSNGKSLREFSMAKTGIQAMQLLPGNQRLFELHIKEGLLIDITSQPPRLLHRFSKPHIPMSFRCSPDGKWMAMGVYSGGVRIYDATTFKEVSAITVNRPAQK